MGFGGSGQMFGTGGWSFQGHGLGEWCSCYSVLASVTRFTPMGSKAARKRVLGVVTGVYRDDHMEPVLNISLFLG